MNKFNCEICGKNHATWEHTIVEKANLMTIGVPPEHLFDFIVDTNNKPDKEDKRI